MNETAKSYYSRVSDRQEDVPPDGNCFFWACARQLIFLLRQNNHLISTLPPIFINTLSRTLSSNLQNIPIADLLSLSEINLPLWYSHDIATTRFETFMQNALRTVIALQLRQFKSQSLSSLPIEDISQRANFIRNVFNGAIADHNVGYVTEANRRKREQINRFLKDIENEVIRPIKERLIAQNSSTAEQREENAQRETDDAIAAHIQTGIYRERWDRAVDCLADLIQTPGYYVGDEASLLMSWVFQNIVFRSDTHNDMGSTLATQYYINGQRNDAINSLSTVHIIRLPWAHYNSAGILLGRPSHPANSAQVSSISRPKGMTDEHELFLRNELNKILMSMPKIPTLANNEPQSIKDEAASPRSVNPQLSNSKDWREIFPYQIAQIRGYVPCDKSGSFFYAYQASFATRFIDKQISTVPFRVIVNIPFYAGSSQTLNDIVRIFENTGFGPNREASIQKSSNALVFVIGVNMMESLDDDLNSKVADKLNEKIVTHCEVHRFGFYWRPKWKDSKGADVPFETVRAQYLTLKKENPTLAKKVLKEIERSTVKMVPYREIREIIKQHFYTSNLAKIFRTNEPNVPVYLGLFDPDMTTAAQVFETYANLIKSYQGSHRTNPVVLTTGYKVPHHDTQDNDAPLYSLAVDLDMAVRQATAQYVKNGVYYPEPNILVLFNSDSMNESFMEGATLSAPKEYTDAYEWPVFMEDLIAKRHLNPDDCFIFDATNPICTTMPARMRDVLSSKEKTQKVFYGRFNNQQKIIRWRISDLRYLIETSQSHALPSAWASRILRSLPADINQRQVLVTTKFKPVEELKKPLEKAIKIFFEQIDPLNILNNDKLKESTPAMKQFSKVLMQYLSKLPSLVANDDVRIQARGNELLKQILSVKAGKQEETIRMWENHSLQIFIIYVLGSDYGQRFIRAGFESTRALYDLYVSKLNTQFGELAQAILDDFYKECANITRKPYASNIPFTPTQLAILEGHYNPDVPSFTPEQLLECGRYNLTALHIAALVGDVKLVKYALSLRLSSNIEADGHVLPLHCAILYLINNGVSETNGNDLPLVTTLISNETRFIKTDMGLTALGLAITRIENAGSVVKQCMIGWDVPYFIPDQIEQMARLASLKERQTPLLAIMNKATWNSRHGYAPRTLTECEKHGFSFLDMGVIENRVLIGRQDDNDLTALDEIFTTTLAEAVRQDDVGTFRRIQAIYETNNVPFPIDITDRDERPLAISAVVNTKHAYKWLRDLKKLGIPLNVVDENDGSPILHEVIFPAASRRLGGTARNRLRYYDGFVEYLNHMTESQPNCSIMKLMTIEFLLREPSININMPDEADDRPLDITLEVKYPIVTWLLLRNGARFNHLNQSQQNVLLESLAFLYLINEIDDESFAEVLGKHPDYSALHKDEWQKLRDQILEAREDRLEGFHYLDHIKTKYEIVFKQFEGRIDTIGFAEIDEYIELMFKHYLMSYEDVHYFYSVPLNQRKEEFIRFHQLNRDTYERICKSNDRYVDKVCDAFEKHETKKSKQELKKELKKQGVSSRQIRMRLRNVAKFTINRSDANKDEHDVETNHTKSNQSKEAKPTSFATDKKVQPQSYAKLSKGSATSAAADKIETISNGIQSTVNNAIKCTLSQLIDSPNYQAFIVKSGLNGDEVKEYILGLLKMKFSEVPTYTSNEARKPSHTTVETAYVPISPVNKDDGKSKIYPQNTANNPFGLFNSCVKSDARVSQVKPASSNIDPLSVTTKNPQ